MPTSYSQRGGSTPRSGTPRSATPLSRSSSRARSSPAAFDSVQPLAALAAAAKAGDRGAVDSLLSEATGGALWQAARGGHAEVVELLLARGAPASAASATGASLTAIYAAAEGGHERIVALLLASGASPDSPELGRAGPLHAAAQAGSVACVTTLVAARANVEARREDGRTALHVAAELGERDVLYRLLDAGGADASAKVEGAPAHGASALLCACAHGRLECVQLLSAYGAERSVHLPPPARLRGASPRARTKYGGVGALRQPAGADALTEGDRLAGSPALHAPFNAPSAGGARVGSLVTAEQVAREAGQRAVGTWLVSTRDWCSALHHAPVLPEARVRALLAAKADPHVRTAPGCQSALDVARIHVHSPAAALVIAAAEGRHANDKAKGGAASRPPSRRPSLVPADAAAAAAAAAVAAPRSQDGGSSRPPSRRGSAAQPTGAHGTEPPLREKSSASPPPPPPAAGAPRSVGSNAPARRAPGGLSLIHI